MRSRLNIAAFAWLLAVLVPAAAAAEDPEEQARIHFQQGLDLYEQGDYEAAAIAFSRAYEIKPSYRILFNIGQAEAELKHYALALEAFARYLAEGGDEIPADRLQKVKSEIKRLNALVGMIEIESTVAEARVKIDNETRGFTPLAGAITVDIGKHEVVVIKGTTELLREVVRVAGGQRVRLQVQGEQGTDAVAGGAPDAAADGGEGEGPERIWTWVAFGVGGAAAIAGGVIGGVAVSRRKALEEDECDDQHCFPSARDEGDTIERLNLTADVLFGVAAAGIVAGVVLYFVEPDEDEQVALTPAVGRHGAGLVVGGRF
jgi:hypothetical protein